MTCDDTAHSRICFVCLETCDDPRRRCGTCELRAHHICWTRYSTHPSTGCSPRCPQCRSPLGVGLGCLRRPVPFGAESRSHVRVVILKMRVLMRKLQRVPSTFAFRATCFRAIIEVLLVDKWLLHQYPRFRGAIRSALGRLCYSYGVGPAASVADRKARRMCGPWALVYYEELFGND